MAFPVDALLVDFDGTLVDSEVADAQAWAEEWDRASVPLSMPSYASFWAAWSWLRAVPMIDRLAAAAPGLDRAEAGARRRARREELCAGLPARADTAEWIRAAAGEGVKVAVVSNDADGRVPAVLERLGLAPHVTAVVTAADGGLRRKPAPDLYRAAAARLGVDPARAVAVEDSPHGAAAAWDAGLAGVICVPNAVTRLLPDSDWTENVEESRPVPLGLALDSALLRGKGFRARGGGQERDTPAGQAAWAAASRAHCGGRDPWHVITGGVLRAAAGTAALDETRAPGTPLQLPRLPLIVQALAFWKAALVTGGLYPGDVPAQLAIDLLSRDDTAVSVISARPARTTASPAGKAGEPALLPADLHALDHLAGNPAAREETRRAALEGLTAAAGASLHSLPRIPRLGTLPGPGNDRIPDDWTDQPGEPPVQ